MNENTRGRLAVAGSSATIFWSGALIFGYPGLLGPYWRKTFNLGTGATGNAMIFLLISLGIFMFLVGKWHAKLGTKAMFRIGTLVLAASLLVLDLATNIYIVYVWAFLNGTASCFFYSSGLLTVQKWFPHRKGLVCGIVNLTFGLSAAIMSPIFAKLLTSIGYHAMNYVVLVIAVITNLLASCITEVPERIYNSGGYQLEPAKAKEAQSKIAAFSSRQSTVSLTASQALKTKSFWFLWLTWAFIGSAGISMVFLSVNYGVSKKLAAVVILASFNLTNGFSRIISGYLSDYIGRNITAAITFIAAAFAYYFLPHFSDLAAVSILAAVIGYAFGTLFTISVPLASDIFGLEHFGVIFGLIFTAYGFIGGILGPSVSGYVLDMSGGDFSIVFRYMALFCLLGAGSIMMVKAVEQPLALLEDAAEVVSRGPDYILPGAGD
ncbi:Major facilitator superfamily MFS_1 [Syntrophobacter sp. SbD1]|nr:Major facilitator superfamily MFS_1 [Syntrophobacter sp. SbD1]